MLGAEQTGSDNPSAEGRVRACHNRAGTKAEPLAAILASVGHFLFAVADTQPSQYGQQIPSGQHHSMNCRIATSSVG